MDPEMLLKAVRYDRVPVGGLLFALLTDVDLSRVLYVDLLEGSHRKCELRDMTGDERSPLQCHQKLRASQGASDDLRGAHGKGASHIVILPSLGATDVVMGGMMGSLWGRAQKRGNPSALYTGGRSPRGRRSWLTGFVDPS